MANFDKALAYVLEEEGGYKKADSMDPGGETYCGITRSSWPSWNGWALIDAAKPKEDFPKCLASDTALPLLVAQFYKMNFWQFDAVTNDDVACKILDMCVNYSPLIGIEVLQKALISGWRFQVPVNGNFGPITLGMVNKVDGAALLQELRVQAAVRYAEVGMVRQAEWAVNKFGWMRRALR